MRCASPSRAASPGGSSTRRNERGASDVRAGGRVFLVLCASSLLFYLSFQLLLAVVPLHTVRLGGRAVHVGLVTGLFAGTAMLLRPVAGVLTDALGRRPLILAGAAIFGLASLGYTAVGSVAALLALRVFHGAGMGLGPTAATVVVADVSPPERRGEAMGVYSLTITTGAAIGPCLGVELYRRLGPVATFLASAAIAAGAVALAWALQETRPAPRRAGAWRAGLFSRAALYPAALVLGLYLGFGALVSFLPLYAARHGLGNPGLLFTVFALAGPAVRWLAGRVPAPPPPRPVRAPPPPPPGGRGGRTPRPGWPGLPPPRGAGRRGAGPVRGPPRGSLGGRARAGPG